MTKVPIDDSLLNEAFRVSGKRTKREAVQEALSEYIWRRRRAQFSKLFGTIEFREDWDYKSGRP